MGCVAPADPHSAGRRFDRDGDGRLDASEFRLVVKALRQLGQVSGPMSPHQIIILRVFHNDAWPLLASFSRHAGGQDRGALRIDDRRDMRDRSAARTVVAAWRG